MGMIARNVKADVNVIALVGERGREVVEFIDRDLGPEGMARTVLVVATSDQPAMMRSKCALTATAIAEYFRDQGMDVLLMMDSLTRFCMAQRGDRPGGRRAARWPWLYPVHLCRPPQAARAFGQLRAWLHHRNLHRPGGR